MDSGSQVTTITETCYKMNFCEKTTLHRASWIKLTGANGLEIPVLGILICDVNLQGHVFKDTHILVVKEAPNASPDFQKRKAKTPGVIGCNILESFYSTVNKSQAVKEGTNQSSLLKEIQNHETRKARCEEVKTMMNKKDTLGFVKTFSNQIIPANTSIGITGTAPRNLEGHCVIVEQLESTSMPGFVIEPTLSQINNGRIQFQVHNFSSNDIVFKTRTRVGKLSAGTVLTKELSVKVQADEDGVQEVVVAVDQSTQMKKDQTWENLPFKVDLGNITLSEEDNSKILQMFWKYSHIFSHSDTDLGFTDTVEHRIYTEDEIPIKQPDRRIPTNLLPEVKKILDNWMEMGIIKESDSPYASHRAGSQENRRHPHMY